MAGDDTTSPTAGTAPDIAALFAAVGMTSNFAPIANSTLVLGQEAAEVGQVRPALGGGMMREEIPGAKFTEEDLRQYVLGLDETELLTLQQGLFSEGYYGTIADISEIEDPINTGRALQKAARDAAVAFELGAAAGMEGAPTLEGRFAEFTRADLDAAKDDYLQKETEPTIRVMPSSAVDRMVENTWKKLLGRKPSAEERRAAFGAVRAAQVAAGEAMGQQEGGVVEQVDVTGILEGRAGTADPMRMAAMSMSESSNLVRSAIGLA